jgi:hypothetical protein
VIVQDNPDRPDRFVMTMDQHTAFAGKLAEAFGNARFDVIENTAVRYVIAHHDAGWKPVDAEVHINPSTGFPYHLAGTPLELTSKTMRGSPDFNAAHHALSGLISSMHTAGLLNGRYGIAPPGILARFEGDKLAFAEKVLADEQARQEELKPLAGSDEPEVWRAYKQLQFFDMLSLYFHANGEGQRGESTFPDVPTAGDDDVAIAITEGGAGTYVLDPFPFAKDGISISFEGRWMTPVKQGEDSKGIFAATDVSAQTVKLSAAA